MKKIIKQISVFVLSMIIALSSVIIPVRANPAVGIVGKEILKTLGYSALGTASASVVSYLMDSWLGTGKEYYDTTGTNSTMNYYAENGNFGEITNSGANNENCYNSYSSTVEDRRVYSLIQNVDNSTTNNTLQLYCPITQQYVTTNNISYNQQYDTYYIENNEYNYYVTNNYTYVSYYIIDNETQEDSYYEIYYELPDGRNSYDLRAYEVWGEYFVYDVVGYDSIKEDDGKTLALYHLNGDTKDSSYWKYNEFPMFNGIFQAAKFGNGLYFSSSLKYYEVAYKYTLPENFDFTNYTIEFTVVSNSESFLTSKISIDSTRYIGFKTSLGMYYFDHYMWEGGTHSFVIQSNNGEPSAYINGVRVEELKTSRGSYYSLIDISSDRNINFCPYYFYANNVGKYGGYIIDEFRISNCALYEGNSITVPAQEFDTNQVLVTPTYFHEGMIAVQASYEVSNYRIGGVRPTYPTDGYVYIYLEDDVVKDIQQFQGDGWYSINGAIRKNGEWVDLKNYDLSVITFDEDTSTDDSGSTDDSSSDSGTSSDNDSVSGNDTDSSSSGNGLSGLLDGISGLFDGIMSIIGKVLEYIGKALDLLSGTVTKIIDIIPQNVTSLLTAIFPFIPEEWCVAIELSIVCAVILGIVRFFKG